MGKSPNTNRNASRKPDSGDPAAVSGDREPTGQGPPRDDERPSARGKRLGLGWLIAGAILALSVCGCGVVFADWWIALPDDAAASYVGRQTCAECHATQLKDWQGSHHDLAMDHATPATVLADFDNATLTHHGIESRMFRRDDKYFVHTEGPDGKLADFEVKYVLGYTPLQQYMVEFDRSADMPDDEIGRLQVLRLSWDTAKRKWFYLSPPDVAEKLSPDDDLHWTGIAQRWNNMCADCHSTNLRKDFDSKTLTYHTKYDEIDVSCEACHGPGSLHVKLAKSNSLFWDRKRGFGLARLKGEANEPEIQACAPCHSRRRIVYPEFKAGDNLFDHYATEMLRPLVYHPDGQIQDEVYVHGSFLQSKMYHKGIRCTDCHDPHTAKLKHQGNKLCTSCHAHQPAKYDTPAHHQHKVGSTGAKCVECHMPETTYMAVDPRRDHSLRVPRPDLSVSLGTPNACSRCHLNDSPLKIKPRPKLRQYADWLVARQDDPEVDRDLKRLDEWAAKAVTEWYGKQRRDPEAMPEFAATFAAARRVAPEAEPELAELVGDRKAPALIRATAVMHLGQYPGSRAVNACRRALEDDHPLVRAAAVGALEGQPAESLIRDVAPLLADPRRVVRTEAARVLTRVPYQQLRDSQRRLMDAASEELEAGLRLNDDRAAAHLSRGILWENRNKPDKAIAAYELAQRVEPGATGPRTNLAALLERLATESGNAAQQAMQRGDSAAAAEAARRADRLTRRVKMLRQAELKLLARDAGLAPNNGWIQYRYGLALYLDGQLPPATLALEAAVRLEPKQVAFLTALVLIYQRQERYAEALARARILLDLTPADGGIRKLVAELEQQAATQANP